MLYQTLTELYRKYYTQAILGIVFVLALFSTSPLSAIAAEYEGGGDGIAVHLAPPILGELGRLTLTSTMLTAWIVSGLLILVAYFAGRNPKLIPSKLQSSFEVVLGGIYDYIAEVLGDTTLATKYFPIITTIFLFILSMNWFGLLPGVTSIGMYQMHGTESTFVPFLYPSATDLNITIALAVVAFITVEVAGISVLGVWKYGRKFINFSSPLAFAIGLIELISELTRLIAFSFRLFGNIFAGKVLLLVMMFLTTSYIVPIPLIAYEVFVGFMQAFIFAILILYFIKIAVKEPHAH